jgi:hypothetical protein
LLLNDIKRIQIIVFCCVTYFINTSCEFHRSNKKNCIATTATVASLPLLVSCLLGGVGRVGVVWVGGYRQLQQAPLETAPKKYINPNTPTFQVTSWVKDEK